MSTEEKIGLAVLVAAVVLYFVYESTGSGTSVGSALSTVGGVSPSTYNGPSATGSGGQPTAPPSSGPSFAVQGIPSASGGRGGNASMTIVDISKANNALAVASTRIPDPAIGQIGLGHLNAAEIAAQAAAIAKGDTIIGGVAYLPASLPPVTIKIPGIGGFGGFSVTKA